MYVVYDKNTNKVTLLVFFIQRILIMVNYIQPRISSGQISKPPPGFQT